MILSSGQPQTSGWPDVMQAFSRSTVPSSPAPAEVASVLLARPWSGAACRVNQRNDVVARKPTRPLLLSRCGSKAPTRYSNHDVGTWAPPFVSPVSVGAIPKLTSHGPPLDPPSIFDPIIVSLE